MATKKKKYLEGLEETSDNIIANNNITEHSQNPNILLSSIDVYKTNYNYANISNEQDRSNLYKFEVTIADNLKQLTRNVKEVCEKLYNAQQLLANHDKTNGMFCNWFESIGLEKNFVYRCIERYNLFLDSQQSVYLSNDVPIRTIQLLKSVNRDVKIEIAELLSSKKIVTFTQVQNYLFSHVRKDNEPKQVLEKIQNKKMRILRTDKEISIKLKISLSNYEFNELTKYLEKLVRSMVNNEL